MKEKERSMLPLAVRHLLPVLLALALVFKPAQLLASGFGLYNQDAKADGMGTAVTSSIDNPSAVFYNPALLTYQPGFGVSANDTIVMPSRTFRDARTGSTADLKPATHNVPSFFANYTRDRLSLGMGVYCPFGLSTDWGRTWIGRYSTIYSQLSATFVTPTIAYRFNDRISAGFGLSYVEGSLTYERAIDLRQLHLPDGEAKLTADGNGVGANAGVHIKLPSDFSLAFTARSPVTIKNSGTANFYTPNDLVLKTRIPSLRDSRASTTITLPWQLTAGLAKNIGPLTLETDVVYRGWSSIDRYTVRFADGRPPQISPKDWYDVFTFSIGANYRWSKSLETQLGYAYDMTPAPTRTQSPEFPDANRQLVTGGIGYRSGPFKANLTYQATFFPKVSTTNTVVGAPAGTYEQFIQMVLFTLSYTR